MAIANDQRMEMYKLVPTDHEHLAQVSNFIAASQQRGD